MAISLNNVAIKNLMDFGLSEKEARVYLALIELEVATVTEIAETTNVNRSSTYVVLESLKRKGLVSAVQDQNVQQFVAVSPEMLLQETEDMVTKAEEIRSKIKNILPELKALHKDTKQKPKIRVFEGRAGLIKAFEDCLNSKEKFMREFSASKNMLTLIPEAFSKHMQKRIELGIKVNGIHPDDETEKKVSEMWPKIDTLGKSLFIPQKKYRFPADFYIYDNKIAYLSSDKKGFAIIIESQEIIDVMKNVFDLAHEEAKRITKINEHLQEYKESLHKYKDSMSQ